MKFSNQLIILCIALFLFPSIIFSQSQLNDTNFSGVFFLSYDKIYEDGDYVNNKFLIKRGYITFRQDLNERVNIRFTQDITVDQEGDGEGDIELRLKYALVGLSLNDRGFIKNSIVELGVISRPWIDFEQSINDYRSQRSMFLDNNNILSSADYGISLSGSLGDELEEDDQSGLGSDAGTYGSFHVGIYNGGGYSALENNNNKLIEGRISLRPLYNYLPGFQTSFFGAHGKGNISESPDFRLGSVALSYESERWVTMLQGFRGVGDGSGLYVDEHLNALPLWGWSFFNEFKPFDTPISFIFRYDKVNNRNSEEWITQKVIGGIAYVFQNGSKIIFNADHRDNRFPGTLSDSTTLSVITEIRF